MNSRNKLLVVDDCYSTRMIIRDILQPYDLHILEATNGNDAISTIIKEHPTLVLLDIGLPQKDGFDVLEEMHDEKFDTAVVIISSHISPDARIICADFGVKAYLEKPLDPVRLREVVKKLMELN